MFKPILKFLDMPGGVENINPFDVFYSMITVSAVETLGTLAGRLPGVINQKWRPGEKLKILLLAYSGARNTGAEVRVGECIKQLNQVLGEENIEINMTTLDLKEAGEYFKNYRVNLKQFNSVFFSDIFKLALKNHMIVLVEGSTWKENFAVALLLYFLYGAGLASKLGKPAFSYAVDAGKMNKLNNYLSWYLSQNMTRIITRSADSKDVLERIGLWANSVRVDTAWSQEAKSSEWAENKLKELGWDGKMPLVGLAMQNYFWWPVVPDIGKFVRSKITGDTKNQYKLVYFYDYSKDDENAYELFSDTLAGIMDWITQTYTVQPVLVAMEALDDTACRHVQSIMKEKALLLSCKEYVGDELAAMLRKLELLVTTRYHAMVLSMPGLVPFIGLSRDERIMGVMKELGLYDDYYVDYRTPNLEQVLTRKLVRLKEDKKEYQRVRTVLKTNLPYYYAQMGMLGLDIRKMVRESLPEFPMVQIDETDVTKLVPHIPQEHLRGTQQMYEGLRAKEGVA